MDYELILSILDIIVLVFVFGFPIYGFNLVINFIVSFHHFKRVPHSDKYTKFAILIPARNEAERVVKHIAKSLLNQTYPREYFDVYFIVESQDDPTIQRALKHDFYYFVRPPISPDRRTKGYALQECIEYFKTNQIKYDAYMIFDADNVLESNYLEVMNDMRQAGYEVGQGYRNFTNCSENIFTSTSSVLFLYIMGVTGQARSNLYNKVSLSGTGYYINADIIDEAGGWQFTGMTEDTELTRYCYKNDIKMKITTETQFYDEQAPEYKVWHNQHIRWIWGYINQGSRSHTDGVVHHNSGKFKRFMSQLEYKWSFIPFAILNVVVFLLAFIHLGFSITALVNGEMNYFYTFLLRTLINVLALIGEFAFIASMVIIKEFRRTKFTLFASIACVLTYWMLFLDIVLAFLDGLFNKNKRREWKVIPHSGNIKNKKAIKQSRVKQ